jgi:hypothetical protein
MKKRYKAMYAVFLSFVVVFGFGAFVAFHNELDIVDFANFYGAYRHANFEEMTIQSVSFNSSDNSVFVTAKATHLQGLYTTIFLIEVVIRDETGDKVAQINLVPSVGLKINELTALKVYLNESVAFDEARQSFFPITTLPSGVYSAILCSRVGNSFYSPTFTIP